MGSQRVCEGGIGMSVDIDVDDFVEDFADRLREFLQERERELRNKLRGGVKITQSWGGYKLYIEGQIIYIDHDSSQHRWRFKNENFEEFFNISEKKGEAIVEFLKALAKITSHPEASGNEENFSLDDEEIFSQEEGDLGAEDEETFGVAEGDPAAEDDEIFGEGSV